VLPLSDADGDGRPATGECPLSTPTIAVREISRAQAPDEPGVYFWRHDGQPADVLDPDPLERRLRGAFLPRLNRARQRIGIGYRSISRAAAALRAMKTRPNTAKLWPLTITTGCGHSGEATVGQMVSGAGRFTCYSGTGLKNVNLPNTYYLSAGAYLTTLWYGPGGTCCAVWAAAGNAIYISPYITTVTITRS